MGTKALAFVFISIKFYEELLFPLDGQLFQLWIIFVDIHMDNIPHPSIIFHFLKKEIFSYLIPMHIIQSS